MRTKNFIVDGLISHRPRLKVPVSRHILSEESPTGGAILIICHAVGLHKELYEPFLESLNHMQLTPSGRTPAVSEAWTIDNPNTGLGGIVNEKELLRDPELITCSDCASAIISIIDRYINASDYHRIILIGHSAGVVTSIIAAQRSMIIKKLLPFKAVFLIEMPILGVPNNEDSEIEIGNSIFSALISPTMKRKDRWSSRVEARAWFAKRPPWNTWDTRCLDLHMDHGLRELPTAFYPDETSGVTLSCHRMHEAASYENEIEPSAVPKLLPALSQQISVHLIFGENSPICPSTPDCERLVKSQYQRIVSLSKIHDGGHQVVQEKPEELARIVLNLLSPISLQKMQNKL